MARAQRHKTTLLKHYKKLHQNEKIQTRVSRARVANGKRKLKSNRFSDFQAITNSVLNITAFTRGTLPASMHVQKITRNTPASRIRRGTGLDTMCAIISNVIYKW